MPSRYDVERRSSVKYKKKKGNIPNSFVYLRISTISICFTSILKKVGSCQYAVSSEESRKLLKVSWLEATSTF